MSRESIRIYGRKFKTVDTMNLNVSFGVLGQSDFARTLVLNSTVLLLLFLSAPGASDLGFLDISCVLKRVEGKIF